MQSISTASSAKRKVLFVSYGGGHIAIVNALVKELASSHPEIECVVMALTLAYSRAKAQGLNPLGYKDLLHVTDERAAVAYGGKLALPDASPDVPPEETLAYLGANYLDLIEQMGADKAAEYFANHGRYGFYPINFMRRALAWLKPDLVVTTNSPRSEKAAIEAARDLNIPSLAVLDLFALPGNEFSSRPFRADTTCVLGEPVKVQLLSEGFGEADIAVTGNPAFDGLFHVETRRQAEAFVAARGWQGKKIILWAGHNEPAVHPDLDVPAGQHFPIQVENALRDFVGKRPEYALVVRYHPGEWHTFPRQPDTDNVYFSIPSAESVQPIILASETVVVQTSTVGLESAVAGKRVVSMEGSPQTRLAFSLAKLGVSIGCEHVDRLPEYLEDTGVNSAPTGYAQTGRAAANVVKHIERLLDSRRS